MVICCTELEQALALLATEAKITDEEQQYEELVQMLERGLGRDASN